MTTTLVGLALAVTGVQGAAVAAAVPGTVATTVQAAPVAAPDGQRPGPGHHGPGHGHHGPGHGPGHPHPPRLPAYKASVSVITPALAARMTGTSWHPNCPVPLADLRYVRVTHVDMTGAARRGELVVHEDYADGIVDVFRTLYEARFPIASMRLVDDFGGDDDASMAADNTSAFNCRAITGGSGWSEHSYGRAIDVNPVENPYVIDGRALPSQGAPFISRPDLPGVIHDGDVVVRAFAEHGWYWGGYWTRPIDYQHFSTTNG